MWQSQDRHKAWSRQGLGLSSHSYNTQGPCKHAKWKKPHTKYYISPCIHKTEKTYGQRQPSGCLGLERRDKGFKYNSSGAWEFLYEVQCSGTLVGSRRKSESRRWVFLPADSFKDRLLRLQRQWARLGDISHDYMILELLQIFEHYQIKLFISPWSFTFLKVYSEVPCTSGDNIWMHYVRPEWAIRNSLSTQNNNSPSSWFSSYLSLPRTWVESSWPALSGEVPQSFCFLWYI